MNGRSVRGLLRCSGARDQFLAGAAFAAQQDGRVGPGDARDAIEERAHRPAPSDHVVIEIDLGLQQLVGFLQAGGLAALLARDRGQRHHDQQQSHVPGVELPSRRRFSPDAAGGTAERHHRRDDGLPAVELDQDRQPIPGHAFQHFAVNSDRFLALAGGPRGSDR